MNLDLLTVQEAARELRVSPVTVRRYIKSGRLKSMRLGRNVRLRRDDIDDLVRDDGVEEFWKTVPVVTTEGLSRLVGTTPWNAPIDVASNKHKYLLEDFEAKIAKDRETRARVRRNGEAKT